MVEVAVPEWPSGRVALHRLQGVAAPPQGWVETVYPPGGLDLEVLSQIAADGYRAAFPDAELVEHGDHDATYLFDLHDDPDDKRSPRVVAAWCRSDVTGAPRNRSRQAGYPMSRNRIDSGYERGHLLAHATGGGLDENLFAQAGHVNQGRSPAGREYRRLERLAGRNPGCLIFHRLVYGDGSDIPDLTHLAIGLPGATHAGTFDNRPQAWTPPTDRLGRGQRFHRDVQTAFLAGLVGADARPEHTLALSTGRRRVDLLVVPVMGGEKAAVVVEIKNTDWDALRAERVRPNLRRHLRQLQEYLDPYVDQLGAGDGVDRWDAVIGILLYPKPPTDGARQQLIEQLCLAEAITVAWYDEADWRSETTVAE